jgi:hypothetical protein
MVTLDRNYTRALTFQNCSPEGHYNAADILLQNGEHEKALRYARAAAALRPSFSQAFVLIVLANEALRDVAAGLAASEEAEILKIDIYSYCIF